MKESRGGALDLVKEIVSVFEGFRDEGVWEGEKGESVSFRSLIEPNFLLQISP